MRTSDETRQRLRAAALAAWARRRAEGRDHPAQTRSAETTRKRVETMRRHRAERMGAMSQEERLAEVRRDHAARSSWARRGWKTRRENAGLPAGPVEASKPVQVYVADLAFARSLAPDAKPARAFRVVVAGLRMAMEAGAVRWTGEKWELGTERPQEAPTVPPPPSTRPAPLRALLGIVDAVRGFFSKRLDEAPRSSMLFPS